jgi:very-short-patch-repair endonuclease
MTPLESPIEWMLAAAIRRCVRAGNHFTVQNLVEFPPMSFDEFRRLACNRTKVPFFGCAPQVSIESYRVDFLFVTNGLTGRSHLLAVECDGHDFHERTREQATRDRGRDRSLMNLGIPVMRFTGSEISRNADACAAEIHAYLGGKFKEEIANWSRLNAMTWSLKEFVA